MEALELEVRYCVPVRSCSCDRYVVMFYGRGFAWFIVCPPKSNRPP